MFSEYANFEIAIEPRQHDGTFPFSVRSPGGDARGVLRLPTGDPTYQTALQQLGQLQTNAASLQELGQLLFDCIFQGQVKKVYDTTQGIVEGDPNRGLRITINISDTEGEVGAMPWEFLYDADKGDHLALLDTAVMRYLQLSIRQASLTTTLPLKVLLTGAQVNEPLKVERELGEIQAALAGLAGNVSFEVEPHLTLSRFQQLLRKGFHVWHFVGHGSNDAQSGGALLFEEDDAPSEARPVSVVDLNRLLNRRGVQLVVLNACNSAQLSTAPLRSLAPALIRAQVPAVVAMQFAVSDQAARAFASEFYRTLAEGGPIDACVTEGRLKVSFSVPAGRPDWGIPVVYSRAPNGKLFDLPARANALPTPATPVSQTDNGNIPWNKSNADQAMINTGTINTTNNAVPADLPSARMVMDDTTDEQIGVQLQQIKALQDRLQYLKLQESRGAGTAANALDIKDIEPQLLAARRQIVELWSDQLARFQRIKEPDAATITRIKEVNASLLDAQIKVAKIELEALNKRFGIVASQSERDRVGAQISDKTHQITTWQQELNALQ